MTTSALSSSSASATYGYGNYSNLIQQLVQADSYPIQDMQANETVLQNQYSDYASILSSLQGLQTSADTLSDPATFKSKLATVASTDGSSSTLGTATADTTALSGSFTIDVTTLPTASVTASGNALTSPYSGSSTANTVFGIDDTNSSTGNEFFTINNTQITINGNSTMDQIAAQIATVPGVTSASYNSTTGEFNIASSSPLILGTAGDTSAFLKDAHLYNNGITSSGGTYSVQSASKVGTLSLSTSLGSLSFSNGQSITGNGTLTVNGVAINYATTDTVTDVLNAINNSSAGVVATYDSYADKINLTSKTRGDLGISVGDSQLASAFQVSSSTGAFTAGNDTQFSVNGGATRTSSDSTLSAADLGIQGVTFTPTSTGTSSVTVSADSNTLVTDINNFIDAYNSSINMVQSYVKIDTNNSSNNGALSSDPTLAFLQSDLRTAMTGVYGGATSSTAIQMLEDLGIASNDSDNTLTHVDATKLADALNNHLDDVVNLFTDNSTSTPGVISRITNRVSGYTDSSTGAIPVRQQDLQGQEKDIQDQITNAEDQLDQETTYLKQSYAALQSAQSQNSQYSSYFTSSSSSSTSG